MPEVRVLTQGWLPGLEPWPTEEVAPAAGGSVRRGRARPGRAPTVDKLIAAASPKVRKLFEPLREALVALDGVSEHVCYDDSAGAFMPAYRLRKLEVLRLHLDPVLAATVTLEPGPKQLALLLESDQLSDEVRARTLRGARKSGRKIFLAFPARTKVEVTDLLGLVRERLALPV